MIELGILLIMYSSFLWVTVEFYKYLFPPPPPPKQWDHVAVSFPCTQCSTRVTEKSPSTVLTFNQSSGWGNYYVCKTCVKKIELEDKWATVPEEDKSEAG